MSHQEGKPAGKMTIRVFFPNPVPIDHTAIKMGWAMKHPYKVPLDSISQLYNVSYLWKNDPIYHELVFQDDKGNRHSIIGLAYHMEETMDSAEGIDASI